MSSLYNQDLSFLASVADAVAETASATATEGTVPVAVAARDYLFKAINCNRDNLCYSKFPTIFFFKNANLKFRSLFITNKSVDQVKRAPCYLTGLLESRPTDIFTISTL